MGLSISQRTATLAHVNARTELHGDEKVTAFDLKFADIPLDAGELSVLLGESEAHKRLYHDVAGVKHPAFPHLGALKIDGKIEDAVVLIAIGLKRTPIRFEAATITKISIALKAGGTSYATLTVQTTPAIDKGLLPIFEALGAEVEVELHATQLDLFGSGQDDEDEDADPDAEPLLTLNGRGDHGEARP
jgi:hypothetical protein